MCLSCSSTVQVILQVSESKGGSRSSKLSNQLAQHNERRGIPFSELSKVYLNASGLFFQHIKLALVLLNYLSLTRFHPNLSPFAPNFLAIYSPLLILLGETFLTSFFLTHTYLLQLRHRINGRQLTMEGPCAGAESPLVR
jgi:hypothetical protein